MNRVAYIVAEARRLMQRELGQVEFLVYLSDEWSRVSAIHLIQENCVLSSACVIFQSIQITCGNTCVLYYPAANHLALRIDSTPCAENMATIQQILPIAQICHSAIPKLDRALLRWTKYSTVRYWKHRERYLCYFLCVSKVRLTVSRDIRQYIWERFFSLK